MPTQSPNPVNVKRYIHNSTIIYDLTVNKLVSRIFTIKHDQIQPNLPRIPFVYRVGKYPNQTRILTITQYSKQRFISPSWRPSSCPQIT